MGLKINDYDRGVLNKTINRRQFTSIWQNDDLKISHAEWAVVVDILRKLEYKFGRVSPLTTTRGKVLEYLGMSIVTDKKGR